MAGNKKTESVKPKRPASPAIPQLDSKKLPTSPAIPQLDSRKLRSHTSIVDAADYSQLSEESKTLLFILEDKFESKFNELINFFEAKNEKIQKLELENATLKRDMRGYIGTLRKSRI